MADPTSVIGLLEDDPDQARLLCHWLEDEGFATRLYPNAVEFRRRLGAESVDLLILDWNLPDEGGPDVLHWLRDAGHARLPVLFLTARNDEDDVVAALRAGADDFLSKPPKQGELMARLGALLRRTGMNDDSTPSEDTAPYRIDLGRRRIEVNGREVPLTDRGFALADSPSPRPGRVISREARLEGVWHIRGTVATRTVATHVSRLRKKLELSGEHGWKLNAVYQHGYRLEQA